MVLIFIISFMLETWELANHTVFAWKCGWPFLVISHVGRIQCVMIILHGCLGRDIGSSGHFLVWIELGRATKRLLRRESM